MSIAYNPTVTTKVLTQVYQLCNLLGVERVRDIKRTLRELNRLSYGIAGQMQDFAAANQIEDPNIDNIWPTISFRVRYACLKGEPVKVYPYISLAWSGADSIRRFIGIYILHDNPQKYVLYPTQNS